MKTIKTKVLSKLTNSLRCGEICDDDLRFILNNVMDIQNSNECETLQCVCTCAVSVAYMIQKVHPKHLFQSFFDKLAKVISEFDVYLDAADTTTDDEKLRLLEDFKNLATAYGNLMALDVGGTTLDSVCRDLVLQSAINDMIQSMMDTIDI